MYQGCCQRLSFPGTRDRGKVIGRVLSTVKSETRLGQAGFWPKQTTEQPSSGSAGSRLAEGACRGRRHAVGREWTQEKSIKAPCVLQISARCPCVPPHAPDPRCPSVSTNPVSPTNPLSPVGLIPATTWAAPSPSRTRRNQSSCGPKRPRAVVAERWMHTTPGESWE